MMTRGQILFLITCGALGLLMLVPRLQGFRVMDDAYMYVRYADHLIQHGEYSWNLGEGNVYGTTSVLYTLFLIPFRLLSPQSASAALVMCSMFWGLCFLALSFVMVLRSIPSVPDRRGWKVCFAALLLVASLPVLSRHFSTGMETTLVLCWATILLMQLQRSFQSNAKPSQAWLGGAFAGSAFFLRPDMLVFAFGIPAVLFLFKSLRKTALHWGLAAVALTAIQVALAQSILGSFLPLPFYAKSTSFYGPEVADRYAGLAAYHLALFLSVHWPAVMVLGLGGLMNFRKLKSRYGPGDWAVAVACLIFAAYYLFLVTPIMGYWQRFYYPLLPFVLWLSTKEWMRVMQDTETHTHYRWANLPRPSQVVLTIAVIIFAGFYGWRGKLEAERLKPSRTLFLFDDLALYKLDKSDYWFRLEALAEMPDDLSIATTEVGMVAALNPGKRIVDLAGLNDPQVATKKITLLQRLESSPPDFIYLPHTDYKQMRNTLLGSRLMAERYIALDEETLEAKMGKPFAMGIAILKDGKYKSELLELLDEHE